jgi:hypothetical protein
VNSKKNKRHKVRSGRTTRTNRPQLRSVVKATPTPLHVSTEGSLRFDDRGGRSKKRGRPAGSSTPTTARRNQQIAEHQLAGQKPPAIARAIFRDKNEKVAYDRLRTYLNRYKTQIHAERQKLMGHLLQEVADSLQDVLPKKRGRPRGKLMRKTLKRIDSALKYEQRFKKPATGRWLYRGLPKAIASQRARSFFRSRKPEIDETRRGLANSSTRLGRGPKRRSRRRAKDRRRHPQ